MNTDTNTEMEEAIMKVKTNIDLPEAQNHPHSSNRYLDKNGHWNVRNLSAFWLPEIPIQEVIHGTIYTVTESYEGNQPFIKKLERIMARQFAEEIEAENDDQEVKNDDKQAE